MRRDPRALLWDVCDCADRIRRFTVDRSRDDYLADEMLRAGVDADL